MVTGIFKTLDDKLYSIRFYLLLITLLLNFFIPPLTSIPLLALIIKLLTTTILLMSGANFIQRGKRKLRNLWFLFGIVNIVIAIVSEMNPENVNIAFARYILLFSFFIVITVSLIQQIFSIKNVTVDVIIGSFCGYLLIGIISFFTFTLLEYSNVNSISGLSGELSVKITQVFYFTFTCLTTIGFGDILPSTAIAQKVAVLTACVGQFYIAVVVAILVSRFMNTTGNTNERV
jgi:voltage-gated potassium channel